LPPKKQQEELPDTGRVSRSARFGGLVAGQGLRWAGTQVANSLRTDERAQRANEQRALAIAEELVKQLGQMKGAAMKFGQVLSTVDFTAIPEGERENFKARLSELRDQAPKVPFKDLRKVIEQDLGGKIGDHFADFDEQALAAASIGQVHRAVTLDGDDVAVKIQYPGVAEAVEADMRNIGLLMPLVKRLAPGLDAKALHAELRERIGEELDYELEAQNQRQIFRAYRGHPEFFIPKVDTSLSTRRVLVTEYVEGKTFAEVQQLPDAERDRFGEVLFRFFWGTLHDHGIALGDPHPGNYLLRPDGMVAFLDFGLVRHVSPEHIAEERALFRAIAAGDADEVHRQLTDLGYLPEPDAFDPEGLLAQMEVAGEWLITPGKRRLSPQYVTDLIDRSSSPRSPFFEQMRQQTLPPESLLIRRMEGLLFNVLGELRAEADWAELAKSFYERP
jgi:predicted unusual protein kinase regulating ubiquinone biosynthesis (AarF/ABC1/UbiB family)